MRSLLLLFAVFGFSLAHAVPFEKGNINKGKVLVEKQCTACHISLFKGDGSSVYTRADHKIKTPGQLTARIAGCNANTGANFFPEDELDVAAYLNSKYYKFK